MRLGLRFAALFACGLFALPAGFALAQSALDASAAPLQGRWLTQSGNLEVEIAPCGAALCGTVTRVLGNRSMSQPGTQMQAVDTQPILGRKILAGFTAAGGGEWKGQLYNARTARPIPAFCRRCRTTSSRCAAMSAFRCSARPRSGGA